MQVVVKTGPAWVQPPAAGIGSLGRSPERCLPMTRLPRDKRSVSNPLELPPAHLDIIQAAEGRHVQAQVCPQVLDLAMRRVRRGSAPPLPGLSSRVRSSCYTPI